MLLSPIEKVSIFENKREKDYYYCQGPPHPLWGDRWWFGLPHLYEQSLWLFLNKGIGCPCFVVLPSPLDQGPDCLAYGFQEFPHRVSYLGHCIEP